MHPTGARQHPDLVHVIAITESKKVHCQEGAEMVVVNSKEPYT